VCVFLEAQFFFLIVSNFSKLIEFNFCRNIFVHVVSTQLCVSSVSHMCVQTNGFLFSLCVCVLHLPSFSSYVCPPNPLRDRFVSTQKNKLPFFSKYRYKKMCAFLTPIVFFLSKYYN